MLTSSFTPLHTVWILVSAEITSAITGKITWLRALPLVEVFIPENQGISVFNWVPPGTLTLKTNCQFPVFLGFSKGHPAPNKA